MADSGLSTGSVICIVHLECGGGSASLRLLDATLRIDGSAPCYYRWIGLHSGGGRRKLEASGDLSYQSVGRVRDGVRADCCVSRESGFDGRNVSRNRRTGKDARGDLRACHEFTEIHDRKRRHYRRIEATVGFEPTNNGFAIHRLSRLATSPSPPQAVVWED